MVGHFGGNSVGFQVAYNAFLSQSQAGFVTRVEECKVSIARWRYVLKVVN